MKIPIKNIYYLLCYAWDKLEEAEKVLISETDYDQAVDLFARVLINGCAHLFARGLDRDYITVSTEYTGIKGKIKFGDSLKKNLFRQGHAICEFDEFEYDILQNQIIKATLYRIARVKSLKKEIRNDLWSYYYTMQNVSDRVDAPPD